MKEQQLTAHLVQKANILHQIQNVMHAIHLARHAEHVQMIAPHAQMDNIPVMEDATIAIRHVKHAQVHIIGNAHPAMMDFTILMKEIMINIVKSAQHQIAQDVKFLKQQINKFA